MTFKRIKWILYVMLGIFTLFFTNDVGLINVERTAIVAALGIDKETDGYAVTVQIALPQSTGQSSGNQKTTVMAQGKTIAKAIGEMADKTGWYPKLSFCNLIVLGEDFLTNNADIGGALDFFNDSSELQDSALLTVCKGKANKLLNTLSPLDNLSAFALEKVFFGNINRSGHIYVLNAKDFRQRTLSLSKTALLPFVECLPAKMENGEQSTQTANLNSQSSVGKEGQGEESYLYNATNTLIFKNGLCVGKLDKEQTTCVNGLIKRIKQAETQVQDGDETALIKVQKTTPKISVELSGNIPLVHISMNMLCEVTDYSNAKDKDTSKYQFTKELKRATEQKFTELTQSLIQKIKESNADFLGLHEKLYRKYPKKYQRIQSTFLQDFLYDVNITVTGVKS